MSNPSRDYSTFSRDYSALSRDYAAISRDYAALSSFFYPFLGIIQPFLGRTHPFRNIMPNAVCYQREKQSIPPRLHENSSYGKLTLLGEMMTMEYTSTKALPGRCVASVFSANSWSER